ncbi:MAG: cell division protein FtsH [Candidatus Andersenbacteria bacterium RIFCSPHIGHO2_12_FULL_45_11b]|uniref:ATP-dependent zinc metalloprotease FtsH n=1 Tax=Candidatus Andersenbacteria bacterium RIFCSPHIGHO2_12_FULL_45_11b TaxID=1797282 RepID=A0A1G1XCN2_9BACT|nr:MAG: cell division protein FtsH [Candidatus Andersenbacteria bacterium RIFCSPHIGHO2_12_FULL_45_11b]
MQLSLTNKNIGIGILVIVGIFLVLGMFAQPIDNRKDVSLSQIVDEIGKNNISNITVDQSDLIATLKSDASQKLVAQKENDASATDTFRNLGVSEDTLKNLDFTIKKPSGVSFWTATLVPVVLPFILLAFFLWFMMRSAQNMGNRAMSFGQTQQGPVDQSKKKKTTFAQVAGNEEAKQELIEIVEFLKHPKKFQEIGARIPKGVLLIGAPGTGKTLMARAVAGEAGVPFFSISGSEFVEMFVGVGASRVRDLFAKVKKNAPAILFIDEMDAVGRHRGAGLGGGHDEREQTLNQILVEMDGFEQTDNVIVLAATNRPDVLDPALLRPGRFDRQVTMELPDIKEREAILKIHAVKIPIEADVDLRNIGERTPGFSGADLANLINEAAIFAARENKKKVSQRHIEDSIEKVLLGPEKRSKVYSKQEKELTAYHEAGHAIVAYYTPDSDPVRKISIISRGFAGGYTLKLPEQDKRLHTKTGFLSELATLMGGYTAELFKYQELTTGASNDLMKATKLARRIVMQFGMSKLGPVTFGQEDHQVFLGKDFSEGRDYSEKTASMIDDEVSDILKDAQKRADEIIKEHADKLELISLRLIEKETIGQKEFADLMGGIDPDVTKEDAVAKPTV